MKAKKLCKAPHDLFPLRKQITRPLKFLHFPEYIKLSKTFHLVKSQAICKNIFKIYKMLC